MKKRILSLILIVCLVITMLPLYTVAEDNEAVTEKPIGDWEYEFYGDGVSLTSYNGNATDIYVPSTLTVNNTEYSVLKLADSIFEDNDSLNSVTLGSGIIEIGNRAFYDCDNMVCILLAEETTTIGNEAFYSCDSFNSVILYDTITTIGTNAFTDCPNLVVWCNEGTVGYIYAIENNIAYEILNPDAIPETIVFEGNTYYISNGEATLISLGNKPVNIIPGYVNNVIVTDLHISCFYADTEVYLPNTITSVSYDFIWYPTSIIHCSENSFFHNYAKENHIQVIKKEGNVLSRSITSGDFVFSVYANDFAALKSYTGTDSIVYVPSEINNIPITKIYPNAFNDLSSVTEIVLPDTIDAIWSKAFHGCGNLLTVKIPEKVEYLPENLFYGCYSIKNVELNNNIKFIGKQVFGYENDIDNIVLPESLEFIDTWAFRDTDFTEITYPINATVMDAAFANGRINKVIIPENVSEFNKNAFLTEYYGLNGPSYDDTFPIFYLYQNSDAINYCDENQLMYHIIGDTEPYEYIDVVEADMCFDIKYIVFNDYAVLAKANMTYYEIDENYYPYYPYTADYEIPEFIDGRPVTSILDFAFSENVVLTDIVLPESINNIGLGAFCGCVNLSNINLNNNITIIKEKTFNNCSSLENIVLPESIVEIGDDAFSGSGLKSIDFPDSLKIIGEWAFAYSNIKELNYPDCEVGGWAFAYCDELEKAVIPPSVNSLPIRVLMACRNLKFLYVSPNFSDTGEYSLTFCPKVMLVSNSFYDTPAFKCAEENGFFYTINYWVDYTDEFEYTQDGITYYLTTLFYNSYYNTATIIGCDENLSGKVNIPEYITVDGNKYWVRKIGSSSFESSNITEITLPNDIVFIGDGAFQTSKLTKINLPQNLKYFGVNMFAGTYIEEFTFPTNYDLNFGVFAFTNALKKIIIPEGVKVIPEYAFRECWGVSELILPESIKLIKKESLLGMPNLKSLIIPGGTKLEERVAGGSGLEKLVFKEGITEIPYKFVSALNLKTVYLPKSITHIDYDAFEGCNKAIFCVYENSYAHEFCKKKGFPYFILKETENPEISYGTGISGKVTYTDGTVASGATVEIIYDDGVSKETVKTDVDGKYEFTYAEVGRYTIRVIDGFDNNASTAVSVKRMNVFNVFVSGDTDLTLKKSYNISGFVNEGGATVTITDMDGNVIDSVTADKNGNFTFENISNGDYVIKAETGNGSAIKEVTVFNGEISDIELVIITDTASVWGYVEVEDRGFNHHKRNWVEVTIYNDEGIVIDKSKSDKNGKYRFENLPLGDYVIVAETAEMRPDKKQDYDRSHSLTGFVYISITEAKEYEADTIVLYEENDYLADIIGKVTAKGSTQVSNVILTNVFGDEIDSVTTKKNGKFAFRNVKDGMYFVTAVTENEGMGFAVIVVRQGKVYGETHIKVEKYSYIKEHEDKFWADFEGINDRDTASKHKERIAEEKHYYDSLSKKEKLQLSKEYIGMLNELSQWIADCEYTANDGVIVEQGGLVVSGDEINNESNITFTINVTKTDAPAISTDGVKNENDFITHSINDKAGKKDIKQYYEITMTKSTADGDKEITSVYKDTNSNGKFRITLILPEEYRGYKHYSFVHEHHGEVVILCDLDDNPDTVTFEVDKFSTFVLTATNEEQGIEVLTGDLDLDGKAASTDLGILRKLLLGVDNSKSAILNDVNNDESIDIRDLVSMKKSICN